ncbi:TPA: replication protein [Yersinia enterocolitica]|nr:replication protein [Yersinia enterocolitica]HDL6612811.1 replication protein [Yersinia enterocolitica]HDL6670708.1 replication protein [Yersinia enterocolitica]HDL6726491.1 replication protein [Yersinia enterocolitica]HDL6735648.1 replication protein [Yersinia enterocolitica]
MSITTPTPTVTAIGSINISGNVIPANWWRHVVLPSGKPDSTAIMLLSDIVYWYRPVDVRDENSGVLVGQRKRFHGDKLQRSYQAFADQFGFSKRETTDALKRLRGAGLINLELRTVQTQTGVTLSNVLFVEPVAERIAEITTHVEAEQVLRSDVTPPTLKRNTPLRSDVTPPTLKSETYTEITTETTHTEITTENTNTLAPSGDDAPAKRIKNDYSAEFETAWANYPKREGSNSKPAAFKCWNARIKEGVASEVLLAGVERYAKFCQAKGQTNTAYVMQATRFFGPGCEYENTWSAMAPQSASNHKQNTHAGFANRDYGATTAPFMARFNK